MIRIELAAAAPMDAPWFSKKFPIGSRRIIEFYWIIRYLFTRGATNALSPPLPCYRILLDYPLSVYKGVDKRFVNPFVTFVLRFYWIVRHLFTTESTNALSNPLTYCRTLLDYSSSNYTAISQYRVLADLDM